MLKRNKQKRKTKTEEKSQKEQKDTETPSEKENKYVLQLIKPLSRLLFNTLKDLTHLNLIICF